VIDQGYTWSDKLAVALTCLGAAMAIVLFLVEKTPATVVALSVGMLVFLIYPIIHFVRGRLSRWLASLGTVALTVILGVNTWPVPRMDLLDVVFSNSSSFTKDVQQRVQVDLTRFRLYVVSLGVQCPVAVPPISLGSQPLGWDLMIGNAEYGSNRLPSGARYDYRIYPDRAPSTDFYHRIILTGQGIEDPSEATALYGMYILNQAIDRVGDRGDPFWQARAMMIGDGAVYLSSSFWDKKMRYSPSVEALWEIRSTLGQPFTDRLLARTVRAFNESAYRKVKTTSPSSYFYQRMRDGAESIGDSGSMKTITTIWTKHGQATD
jgi:hypothetical protein